MEDQAGENGLKVVVKFGGLIKSPPKVADDNLHAVWDSTIIRQTTYDWGSYVDRLENDWLLKHPEAVQTLDPIAWTLESHKLAQDMAAGVENGATWTMPTTKRHCRWSMNSLAAPDFDLPPC